MLFGHRVCLTLEALTCYLMENVPSLLANLSMSPPAMASNFADQFISATLARTKAENELAVSRVYLVEATFRRGFTVKNISRRKNHKIMLCWGSVLPCFEKSTAKVLKSMIVNRHLEQLAYRQPLFASCEVYFFLFMCTTTLAVHLIVVSKLAKHFPCNRHRVIPCSANNASCHQYYFFWLSQKRICFRALRNLIAMHPLWYLIEVLTGTFFHSFLFLMDECEEV